MTTEPVQTVLATPEIINIIEGLNGQVFFRRDKDWYCRSEQRRRITLNDNSNWRKGGKLSVMHIA